MGKGKLRNPRIMEENVITNMVQSFPHGKSYCSNHPITSLDHDKAKTLETIRRGGNI